MKKLLTGIAAAALTLSLCATPALAACHGHGHNCNNTYKNSNCTYYKTSCRFVDKNHDDICDNCNSSVCKKGYGKGYKGHGRHGC